MFARLPTSLNRCHSRYRFCNTRTLRSRFSTSIPRNLGNFFQLVCPRRKNHNDIVTQNFRPRLACFSTTPLFTLWTSHTDLSPRFSVTAFRKLITNKLQISHRITNSTPSSHATNFFRFQLKVGICYVLKPAEKGT